MTTHKNIRFYSLFIVLVLLGVVLASQPSGKRTRLQNKEQEGSIKPIERTEDLRIINKTSSYPQEIPFRMRIPRKKDWIAMGFRF